MTPSRLHECEDWWSEVWEQLPGALQRDAERGDLRIAIQCDEVTEGPRIVIFASHSLRLELELRADGQFTELQIAQLCATF